MPVFWAVAFIPQVRVAAVVGFATLWVGFLVVSLICVVVALMCRCDQSALRRVVGFSSMTKFEAAVRILDLDERLERKRFRLLVLRVGLASFAVGALLSAIL